MSEKIPQNNVLSFRPKKESIVPLLPEPSPENIALERLEKMMLAGMSGQLIDERGEWLLRVFQTATEYLPADTISLSTSAVDLQCIFGDPWIIGRTLNSISWTRNIWRHRFYLVADVSTVEDEATYPIQSSIFYLGNGAALSVKTHYFDEVSADEAIENMSAIYRGSADVMLIEHSNADVDMETLEPELLFRALDEFRIAALSCCGGWDIQHLEHGVNLSFTQPSRINNKAIHEYQFIIFNKSYLVTLESDL